MLHHPIRKPARSGATLVETAIVISTCLIFMFAVFEYGRFVMIKQLMLIYLLTLPIAVCSRCGWWSPVLVGLVSLGLFGMEEASVETEDPFGRDENCLDMEAFTMGIARDAGQMAATRAAIVAIDRNPE